MGESSDLEKTKALQMEALPGIFQPLGEEVGGPLVPWEGVQRSGEEHDELDLEGERRGERGEGEKERAG